MADDTRREALQALVEAFERQTAEQRALLSREALDTEKLSESLAARRIVLEQMRVAFDALTDEGGAELAPLVARLEVAQAMDDENIRLADNHAEALRSEARQMTQTRKGVSSYGRHDLAGSESKFDKKQ